MYAIGILCSHAYLPLWKRLGTTLEEITGRPKNVFRAMSFRQLTAKLRDKLLKAICEPDRQLIDHPTPDFVSSASLTILYQHICELSEVSYNPRLSGLPNRTNVEPPKESNGDKGLFEDIEPTPNCACPSMESNSDKGLLEETEPTPNCTCPSKESNSDKGLLEETEPTPNCACPTKNQNRAIFLCLPSSVYHENQALFHPCDQARPSGYSSTLDNHQNLFSHS